MPRMLNEGMLIIQQFEGCKLQAYRCPAGVLTIGYGHTGSDVYENMIITADQAMSLLYKDILKFERQVLKYDSIYNWTDAEFSALVSFAYNIGSIDQLTQKGTRSKEQIYNKIPEYCKANGKTLSGLLSRRIAEQYLFGRNLKK